MQWDREREFIDSTGELLSFHTYCYEDRKVDVQRNCNLYNSTESSIACAKTHVDNWMEYKRKYKPYDGGSFVFPKLRSVKRIHTANTGIPDGNTGVISGIERTDIDWGSKVPCSDGNVITIINALIACAMGNASFMAANDHRRKWFKNRWLTTHTLRRGGAQHRFFFAKAKYRWSLKMIKYWSGWSEKDHEVLT